MNKYVDFYTNARINQHEFEICDIQKFIDISLVIYIVSF